LPGFSLDLDFSKDTDPEQQREILKKVLAKLKP